jgi:hypothetical protein
MAVTAKMFSNAPHLAYHGLIADLASAGTTVKCCLLTATATPSQESWAHYSDVDNEVSSSGTGYTTGGAELGTKTLTETAKVTKFDADDALWQTSTISAAYAVVYDATTTVSTTQPLLVLVDFGGTFSSTAGDFKITWSTNGIFTDTVA